MKRIKVTISRKLQLALVLLGVVTVNVAFLPVASAATFMTHATVMETNMNTSGQSALIVAFTAGAADSGNLVINMGTATSAVLAAPAISTTYNGVDCKTITGAANDLPGTLSSSGNSNPTITVTGVTALTAGQSYCVVVGSFAAQTAVTNVASSNSYAVTLTDGTDSATVAIDLIANDQVVVNATVAPAFTLALSGNTDNFTGNLSSGSIATTTGVTATVNTNAKTGWFLWGSDSNTGIKSATQNYTVPSRTPGTNATLTNGTEGYLTGLPAGGITQGSGAGTTTATTAYASSGSGNGSGLDGTPRQLASSDGTANGAIVTVKEFGTIAGTTPAASDYSDTVTLVGAGSF